MGSLDLSSTRRLAVVGVAKNCGKTTTLNAIVAHATSQGRVVGLASVGIDGEAHDVLIGTEKPPIYVVEGQWLVSATGALESASASLEFVDDLGIDTPLGRVVLVRAESAGHVVLAGLRHRADLAQAVARLEAHVDLVVIDGAYGRVMAAHADVVDSVVVSTGAVVSPQVKRIVAQTHGLLTRLALPPIKIPWEQTLMMSAIENNRVLMGGPTSGALSLPARSALLGLAKARKLWTAQVEAVAIPGLVSDRVVEELVRYGKGRTVLVPDGTVIQCDLKHLNQLLNLHVVRARASAKLLGLGINPTSIQGYTVSEGQISQALSAQWPNVPMFNPRDGLESL